MHSGLHSGAYVMETSSGSDPVGSAGTSTACLIGCIGCGPENNEAGIDASGFEPMPTSRYDACNDHCMCIRDTSDAKALDDIDQMGHSVAAAVTSAALSPVQRIGSAFNLKVHLHMLVLGSVYTFDRGGGQRQGGFSAFTGAWSPKVPPSPARRAFPGAVLIAR